MLEMNERNAHLKPKIKKWVCPNWLIIASAALFILSGCISLLFFNCLEQKKTFLTASVSNTKPLVPITNTAHTNKIRCAPDSQQNDRVITDWVNIELRGILSLGGELIAFLNIENESTVTAKEGDKITSGLMLEKIEPEYIIVRHTHELEKIEIRDKYDFESSECENYMVLNAKKKDE